MTAAPDIVAVLRAAASLSGLPADLVLGVAQVESGFQVGAVNPEPPYRYLVNVRTKAPFRPLTPAEIASEVPPDDFPAPPNVMRDAEWWCQQMSWGLMQIMGSRARELGYAGPFLTGLCNPEIGARYGCAALARDLKRWGSIDKAIAAYNAGSPRMVAGGRFENQGYVDKVTAARAAWV